MPSTTYDLTSEWSAAARYTADEEDRAVLISNLNQQGHWVAYALTGDDDPPPIPPRWANPLLPEHAQAMTLADGERLWLAMWNHPCTGHARVQE